MTHIEDVPPEEMKRRLAAEYAKMAAIKKPASGARYEPLAGCRLLPAEGT